MFDAIFESLASSPDTFSQSAEDSLQRPMLRDADLLAHFKSMLQVELLGTMTKLATHLTNEIRVLRCHTNDLEDKMDTATTVLENQEQDISDIKKELEAPLLHLRDFENRACRGNLRLQGIPETARNLISTANALFQEPANPIVRLEFDHIHQALDLKEPEGAPRDIIIKFTY